MSDVPPPPQFAAYPRAAAAPYGSVEKLEALAQGYFGLNQVFGINVVIAIAANALFRRSGRLEILLVAVVVMFLVIGGMTLPYNKKIAFGKDWPPSAAILASLLMGLNSALCCGVVGYVVMQQIASQEMKKYGIKGGFFGLKKKTVEEEIARRRAMTMPAPPPPTV